MQKLKHAPQRPARNKGAVTAAIPDKLYFRIGEVAKLCQVQAYVLRFWESEFPQMKPNKSGTGQRLYRKRDVELALRVKRLLHEEGYTIAGARQVLQSEGREGKKQNSQPDLPLKGAAANHLTDKNQVRLQRLRAEMKELLGMLSSTPATASHNSSKVKKTASRTGPGLFGE
ncbi:MAG TPA: MerR family transcriptional regulator [Pseudacidobacterium sp.]|jgi:DNA-binding transcriptional MerR regulator|nr:MerR family transcriptional regulator [Pseudacidobacterium sp.]